MKTENNNLNHLNEQGGGQIVFAPKNGKPGYRVKNPDGSLGQWIEVDKSQLNSPGLQADIDRYVKAGGKVYVPPKPKPKPEPTKPAPEPTKPAPEPAQPAQPAPAQPSGGGGGGGGGSTPSPAPAAPRPAPAAPKPSPVADYMKAAAAARKSGDPAEMAKVRDMGMEIWAKKYKTTLAPKVQPGQSGYETIQKVVNPPAPAPTPKVTVSTDKEVNKVADELSKNPLGKKKEEAVKKEAYDVVLDYILSEGHADTLSEAHYVMLQMDAEHIQNIVQERWSWNPMDWGKPEATPKNVARATPTRGYNPNTGTTRLGTPQTGYKDKIMASRGGVAGAMVKGKPETWAPVKSSDPGVKAGYARYRVLRGEDQLAKDAKNNAYVSAVTKDFDRRYADVYRNPAPEREGLGPRPAAPAPKPAAKPAAAAPKPAAPAPAPKPVAAPEPRLTKAQQDILDLRQMRANSLNRQGNIDAAQKLQTEVDVARADKKMPPKIKPEIK